MRMKTSVGEALPFVLAEESTVTEHDMVNFISGTFPVQSVPLLRRLLAFPVGMNDRNGKKISAEVLPVWEGQPLAGEGFLCIQK